MKPANYLTLEVLGFVLVMNSCIFAQGELSGTIAARPKFLTSNIYKVEAETMVNYQRVLLHTGTALHETDNTFAFALAPNRDLFAIKKSHTGTNSTEVHVLSAVSNYQEFVLRTGTALHETDDTFAFALAPNRDLFVIKKNRTGTNSTEVHVLSAVSNYQEFVLRTGTALHETDDTFVFALAPNCDLFAIKKNRTGTNSTEVHVLSAVSNYQEFVLRTATALHETDDTFAFVLAPNRDLFTIKKSRTGTNSTEVHVLSAASNYQEFVLRTGTALHETDDTFAFGLVYWNADFAIDLMAIKKSNTGTHSTEVHILSGRQLVGFRILVDTNQLELKEAERAAALAADGVWAITHNSPDIPKHSWPATLARLNANQWAVSEDDPNQSYEVNAVQEYIRRRVDGAMCYFEGRPDDNTVLTNDEINAFVQTHGNKIVVLSRSYGSADLRRKAVNDALQNSNCSGVVFETNPESEGGVMWNQDFNDGIKHCLSLGKHCYLLLPPKNDRTTDYVEDIKSAMRYFVHSGELYNRNLFVVLAVYGRELSKVGYFEPKGNNVYEALTWLKSYRDDLRSR
jgi:hypothetical protein